MNSIDQKRLAEVKLAARAAAPLADKDACAAALLVIVFNEDRRNEIKATDPMLWEQILNALGPLSNPSNDSLNAAAL